MAAARPRAGRTHRSAAAQKRRLKAALLTTAISTHALERKAARAGVCVVCGQPYARGELVLLTCPPPGSAVDWVTVHEMCAPPSAGENARAA